jgi:hypothetical protein
VSLPIIIAATDNVGRQVTGQALIINLSRGGAALQLPFETAANNSIMLHWQDKNGAHQICALPRWQRPHDDQWRMGVEAINDLHAWRELIYHACKTSAQL